MTCATCRYFRKAEAQYIYGDCHRYPPQFNFSANFTEDGYERRRFKVEASRHANGVWPNVYQEETCGEYQDKTDGQAIADQWEGTNDEK